MWKIYSQYAEGVAWESIRETVERDLLPSFIQLIARKLFTRMLRVINTYQIVATIDCTLFRPYRGMTSAHAS